MPTYNSLQKTPPVFPVSGVGIGGRSLHVCRGEFALTAALALNDLVNMFDVPRNFRCLGASMKVSDLDTGGSPAIVLSLGDAGVADRFMTGLTIGQAGGYSDVMAATGADFLFTAKTTVAVKVTTGPATGATTGTIVAWLVGIIEEPA